jgi:hypothetical protein
MDFSNLLEGKSKHFEFYISPNHFAIKAERDEMKNVRQSRHAPFVGSTFRLERNMASRAAKAKQLSLEGAGALCQVTSLADRCVESSEMRRGN